MTEQKMYQVSTLQALAMGYSRAVVSVKELLKHGDIGLGTFEDVDGEMILSDGICFRARADGSVVQAPPDMGVPFSAVTFLEEGRRFEFGRMPDIDSLRAALDLRIEEDFGLNSMHIARIDGVFERISARSEAAYRSHHITLKTILEKTQRDFFFERIRGTLVCVYFPDHMDGINAPGWHLHFISEDKKQGGHVFDLVMKSGKVQLNKIGCIEIRLPQTPAFDTYSLKDSSAEEIRQVEQGKD